MKLLVEAEKDEYLNKKKLVTRSKGNAIFRGVYESEKSDLIPKGELKSLCNKWTESKKEMSIDNKNGRKFKSKNKLTNLVRQITIIRTGNYVIVDQ